jgi:hypothetical protein
MLRPTAPPRALTALRALRDFGPLGGMLTAAALQHGDRDALIDDGGRTLSRSSRRSPMPRLTVCERAAWATVLLWRFCAATMWER